MKTSVLTVTLFFAIIFFIAPAQSQSINPIKADTVFKGYMSGETSSVKFINQGTRIIYIHDGALYEMSALTYKPIRKIALEEAGSVIKFDVDENCKYIIFNIKNYKKTYVADYNTGKTLSVLEGTYFLTKDFLFVRPDVLGTPTLSVYSNVTVIEINDLSQTSVLRLGFAGDGSNGYRFGDWYCGYEKNIIIYQIYKIDNYARIVGTTWFYFDMKEKIQKVIETFSNSGSGFYSTQSNNLFVLYGSSSINIYNSTFKLIANLNAENLKKYYNDADFSLLTDIGFLNDQYMLSSVKYNDGLKIVQNVQVYDILAKKAIKFIEFENYKSACYNDKFILSNKTGCFVTLTLEQLPVIENNKISSDYLVTYSNNGLSIFTDEAQKLDISIMNLTSEIVESLNDFYLNEGSNTIPLNTQLANGLYFCIIKTPETTISRKFMVIK